MRRNTLQAKWDEFRFEAQNWWGRLTNEDLDQVAGNSEKLIGKVQERYGYARDRAAEEVAQFERRCARVEEWGSAR